MLGSPTQANAGSLTVPEWKDVGCPIDRYIQSQYVPTDDGEYGFIYTPALYRSTVDNNGVGGTYDGTVCGVGDNIGNRPVLVDNLATTATLIPGTSIRNSWNTASPTLGGMSPAVLTAVKARVDAHREAGFSDDIAVY